jgi:hypothetical protein
MEGSAMHLHRGLVIVLCLGLLQCSLSAPPTVGAPCTPSLESDPAFAGFRITEETIEVGAPECGVGVCLVNHFQGRVSCPLGQPTPDPAQPETGCQEPGASPQGNAGKTCCSPGSTSPVETPVCGQCVGTFEASTRDAENAVYCTCRCGVAEGEPPEPDYPFCACPDGFECSEIRKYLGVGDPTLTGKYCIKAGTAYDPNEDQCGQVDGTWQPGQCAGVGTGQCLSSDGPCEL